MHARYVEGQLIVKYKDSVTECVHHLLASPLPQPFKAATTDRSDSLDQLRAKYKVAAARPVFRTETEETTLVGATDLRSLKRYHAQKLERVRRAFPGRAARAAKNVLAPDLSHVYVLEVPADTDIEAAVAEFANDPHVEYAQPNYRMEPFLAPNDPYYASTGSWGQSEDDLWGLKKLQAEQAWAITQGDGIVVAVVDTGLDYAHPDIAANVWTNPGEISNNGVDDDHNGYIDDVRGWNFAASVTNNDSMDRFGHGTHVAGTIAAVGNNSVGVIGVAPQAKIMAVKGLDDSGSGTMSGLANALVYATQQGADVLNNSWGCSSSCPSSPVIEEAIRTVYGLGAVAVFAAGNSSSDVSSYSPQNMTSPKPVVVAAITPEDAPTFFTNFGASLDVAAPGGGTRAPPPSFDPFRNILSLKSSVCSSLMCPAELVVGGQYVRQAGTSMATPHAAGVTALILAHHPAFTNDDVRQVLRTSADDIGAPSFDINTGAGRLNAARALAVQSVLQVLLTSPSSGTVLDNQATIVPIQGTAAGTGFDRYELFYAARDVSMATWISLGPAVSTPVVNGLLGTWDVRTLPPGRYMLRLVATTEDGWQFETITSVFCDSYPVRQITTSPATQWYPAIDGDRIVWADNRNGNWDIYLYDLNTNEERQITTNTANQWNPAISSHKIIYMDNRDGESPTRDWELYLYDLTTNTEQQLTSDAGDRTEYWPKISGNHIVWTEDRSGTKWVVIYDVASGARKEIATVLTNGFGDWPAPDISGDRVVWIDKRSDPLSPPGSVYDWYVYLYDLATETQQQILSHPVKYYAAPKISGNRVLWVQEYYNTSISSKRLGINLYDLTTQTEQQIVQDPSSTFSAEIDGSLITWTESPGNADVFFYDLTTGTQQRVTAHPSEQTYPVVSGGRIVWNDERNGNVDIYLAEVNRPPSMEAIGARTVAEGQPLTMTISATDPDDDLLAYTATDLPAGATFADHIFNWTPEFTQAGAYEVTFMVSDGALMDTETITITVQDVNRAPTLQTIGDQTVSEGSLLMFNLSGVDPDGDTVTYSATTLPAGASLIGQTLRWTPGFDQAGSYPVTFTVSDGSLTDTETSTITVLDALQLPPTPLNLKATVVSKSRIDVSWSDVTEETRYELQHSLSANFNKFLQTFTLGANTIAFADTSLKSNTSYYYRLRACNSVGCSAYSSTATAKTPRK